MEEGEDLHEKSSYNPVPVFAPARVLLSEPHTPAEGSCLVASLKLLAVLHTNLVVVRDDVSLPVPNTPR